MKVNEFYLDQKFSESCLDKEVSLYSVRTSHVLEEILTTVLMHP
jgi:hypothetical protein